MINEHGETRKYDRMQDVVRKSALPSPALLWQHCDSECIFVTLEMYLTTLFSETFCFADFWDGMDRMDGHMDRQTFLRKYCFR